MSNKKYKYSSKEERHKRVDERLKEIANIQTPYYEPPGNKRIISDFFSKKGRKKKRR